MAQSRSKCAREVLTETNTNVRFHLSRYKYHFDFSCSAQVVISETSYQPFDDIFDAEMVQSADVVVPVPLSQATGYGVVVGLGVAFAIGQSELFQSV